MEIDRTRRYETASAFAADVQRYLDDEPVAAGPPSAWYHFRKFARRRRGPLAMAAVVSAALVLVAGSIGWVARDHEAHQAVLAERDQAIQSRERAETAEARARFAEKEMTIRSHLGRAKALRLGGEPGHRGRALAEIRSAMALDPTPSMRDELRNEAIACLAIGLDLIPAMEFRADPTNASNYDIAANLRRFARADRQGNVTIHRVTDDKEVGRIASGGAGTETSLLLSPDGQFLVTHYRPSTLAKVWKLGADQSSLVWQGKTRAVDFHPSKPILAVGSEKGGMEVIDLSTGKRRGFEFGIGVIRMAWHPLANQIAIGHAEGVKIFDLDTEQWVARQEDKILFNPGRLAWHPKGRMLAIACSDGSAQLWKVEEGPNGKLVPLEKKVNGGACLAFNHRGDLLASTAWGGILKLWDPRTGKLLRQLDSWVEMGLGFSADDRLIAARVKDDSLQFWQVISAGEYRAFVPERGLEISHENGAISPEGRLLAVGMVDGVGFWDVKTGGFLSYLPIGETYGTAFNNAAPPGLLTNGPAGTFRWPIQWNPKSARMRIGPPKLLPLPGNAYQIGASLDGQIVLQPAGPDGGRAFWQFKQELVKLAPHRGTNYIAISPDARWIATGSHHGTGARIWDAKSGKLVRELGDKTPSWDVEFSGDGLWLATRFPACQLWKVGTWEKALRIEGSRFCFAPDGKMLAIETGSGAVRLVDPASGHEFARLANPYQERADRIFFSPDGAFLLTLGGEAYPIHVWDLRAIRRQLSQLGLDWDMPPFPPEGPAWAAVPLQLQIELGDLKVDGNR